MRLSTRFIGIIAAAALTLGLYVARATPLRAQQNLSAQPVTVGTLYAMNSISATAAVNTQVTLTIPAPPPGFYNYVCSLHFDASQQVTSPAAATNAVTTSTNFNSWALKFSLPATASQAYDWTENWGIANVGCAKSVAPGTATTFVSPAIISSIAYTWSATYYQAP